MFGGAIGGGKTDALIRWLREGVQHRNFSGLFLRRTFSQLMGSPTTPIERSYAFFKPLGGKFNSTHRYWTWPNGAMIAFGHMQYEMDKHNYDGHEYHRIAFDQVEQFSEGQYTYMFSRMRRLKDYPITCGMRSAANPIGGSWVKHRFVTDEAIKALKSFTAKDPSPPGMWFRADNGAIYMPSRIADNPSLEVDEYIDRLQLKLGAVLAAKLANGDWSVVEGSIIDPENLRYFSVKGQFIIPLQKNHSREGFSIDSLKCKRFATIDTAGTSKQRAKELKGANPSWSACGIWDYYPGNTSLFLRHVWRKRVDWLDLKRDAARVIQEWRCPNAYIEGAHHGQTLAAELRKVCKVELINPKLPGMKKSTKGDPHGAKYERSISSGLLGKIERGEFYLPDAETVPGVLAWLRDYESELLGWTGLPDETSDQVDMSSYAAYRAIKAGQSWGGAV